MGIDYTVTHAAALAACLPTDSATLRAEFPANRWTITDYLLRAIEFNTRVLCWQKSKDGQSGRNKPKPMSTPIDEARMRKKAELTDFADIANKLGLNLEGVDNG